MKKHYLIILISVSILSCSQKHINDREKEMSDGFYNVLNVILKEKFSDVPISIIKETMPVYRTPYGKYPVPIAKIETPPPPPPPGIIYYSSHSFDYYVMTNQLDSIDAGYMFHSIDSTKIFVIDSSRTNKRIIPESRIIEIFRAHKGDSVDRFEEIKKIFGTRCFISISTPIFNSNCTKILVTVIFRCGHSKDRDYDLIYGKKNGKWEEIIGEEIIETR